MQKPNHYKLNLQLFAEENKQSEQQVVDPSAPTVEALKKLKESTVSKEAYEKLEGEYKQALDAIINGNSVGSNVEPVKPVSIEELREDLFSGKKHLSNLEYCTKALALRDELMARGETDPFLPVGKRIVPEQSDIEAANRVAEHLRECIEIANGDSAVFTNELQRRMIDTLPRR